MYKKEKLCLYKNDLIAMVFKTRLLNFFFKYSREKKENLLLNNKEQRPIDYFTQRVCLLLIGFLLGNLFGTFLNTMREFIPWDGIIVFILLGILETVNYNVYHNKDRAFFFFVLHPKTLKREFWKSFNFLKIGCMMGFFVDAFKVGS